MKMPPDKLSLWNRAKFTGLSDERFLATKSTSVALNSFERRTILADDIEIFRNKSVLIHLQSQLSVALALIELDGVAHRLILCQPEITAPLLREVALETMADIILVDTTAENAIPELRRAECFVAPLGRGCSTVRDIESEWILFTSGTTGRPKQVIHTLRSLIAPLQDDAHIAKKAIWTSFYDIRRYGGLQIFFRALLTGGSIIFSEPQESISSFFHRIGTSRITHISGTPSHWRHALMSGSADRISPAYIRLSGEIVDQGILDRLRDSYPNAKIVHAFASTEAGVAFDVRDCLAGFPVSFLDQPETAAVLKIHNGTLHIRSACMAQKYENTESLLQDNEGFVDTGDLVELRKDRYHFIGRRQGVINVGGFKVYPEEVEAILNQHPAVEMSYVQGRRNSIIGSLVIADIVIKPSYFVDGGSFPAIKTELLLKCRHVLPPHKIPTVLREVTCLNIAASGKILRRHV